MLDLNLFYRSPNESWADMMDEEEGNFASSDLDDADAVAKTKPKSTTATQAKEQEGVKKPTVVAATPTKPEETQPKPEPQSKKSDSSGIVWRIPSAEERKKQWAAIESLVEQRLQNIDKLDSWRPNDNDNPRVGASDLATSWRRPVQKYDRIPVRPRENNNVNGWAAYSETLQKEYDEEREAAKQEFIKRFGTTSTEKENKMAKPAPPEILITANGPSDWADDIPLGIDEDDNDEEVEQEQEQEMKEEEEKEEKESEQSVVEEELAKELDTKIILGDEDNANDNQIIRQQSDHDTRQGQGEERGSGAVVTIITKTTEEAMTHAPCTVDTVVPEEGSMNQGDYASLSNNSNSHGTPENMNSAEVEHKPSSPPPPSDQGASRWLSFALEETRKTHGLSLSPSSHTTTASSSTSTVETKSHDTLQYFSNDNNRTQVLSHSSSTSTETSGDVQHLHQRKPPAPPHKGRSALSQITNHLLKNATVKDLSPKLPHSVPHPTPAPQGHPQQPQPQIKSTDSNNSGEDYRIQVSPSAREIPITITGQLSIDHHESSVSKGLSPSSGRGWAQPSSSPRYQEQHSYRLSASPASRNSEWQQPTPRSQHQDKDPRSSSPSRETRGEANTSWQSFARNHSAQSSPHYRG